MKTNKFYENFLILIMGLIFAISVLAVICGDGDKGLLDLFQ